MVSNSDSVQDEVAFITEISETPLSRYDSHNTYAHNDTYKCIVVVTRKSHLSDVDSNTGNVDYKIIQGEIQVKVLVDYTVLWYIVIGNIRS